MSGRRRGSWFSYSAFPCFIALLLILVYAFRSELLSMYLDRVAIRDWIRARGTFGELAFIGLQLLQVAIFVIPGEVAQVAGGYIYGLWKGSALSLSGIVLGSIFNFAVGRALGRPFIEAVLTQEKLGSIERILASGRASAGFFLLFVIPGIPKDALCYAAGISRIGLPAFLVVSTFGRVPGIIGSSFMGSAAYAGSYRAAFIVLIIASALFSFGLLCKERIQRCIVRIIDRGKRA